MKGDFKFTPLPTIEVNIKGETLNTKQLVKMCKEWVHTHQSNGTDWVNYMHKRYEVPREPLETIVNLLYGK
jgi:hypothetical protein